MPPVDHPHPGIHKLTSFGAKVGQLLDRLRIFAAWAKAEGIFLQQNPHAIRTDAFHLGSLQLSKLAESASEGEFHKNKD
jgi:hypothetical protein